MADQQICASLQTRGEILGVLFFMRKGTSRISDTAFRSAQQLAVAAAESFSLALSNLRLRESLRAQAIRDPLTGVYNRRYMEESVGREIGRADRRNSSVGLIILDLDHFKRLNDTYGHAAGDLVLETLGAYLKEHSRSEDIVCRYGGEEFVLVLPDIGLEGCRSRAEELRRGIERLHLVHEGTPLGKVTASIGVSSYPGFASGRDELYATADRSLYQAKSQGRNRVVTINEVVPEIEAQEDARNVR